MLSKPTHARVAPGNYPSATVIPFKKPFKKPSPTIPPDILVGLDKIHGDLLDVLARLPKDVALTGPHWEWLAPLHVAFKYAQISKRRAWEIAGGDIPNVGDDIDGTDEVGQWVESFLETDSKAEAEEGGTA